MYNEQYPLITNEQYLTFLICGIGCKDEQLAENRPDGFIYQIMITESGRGRIVSGGQESFVEAKDVFLFPATQPHFYEPISEKWQVKWITFSGCDLDKTMQELDILDNKPVHFDDIGLLESLFDNMLRLVAGRQPFYIHSCAPLLYEFVIEIFKAKHRRSSVDTTSDSCYVSKITEYIRQHFDEYITLEELALLIGHSKQFVCRIFKKEMGLRPFEYITQCRLQKAKQLLINTTLPVNQIGKLVGYEDKSYFGHIFRKYEHKSPQQYRDS